MDLLNKKGLEMENVDTIIGTNVKIKGSLKNQGSIQINGTVEGDVKSDQMVTVGETATVVGPIVAKTIEISGVVRGIINGGEKVEVNPKGQIQGDIITKTLIIKQGAIFNGKSQMSGEPIVDAAETEEENKK
jgi:cytoskeletal protein CcmA (bactofilin family)